MTKDSNTEEKIIQAAQDVFQEAGFHGARMQQIADKASINKGLLHYYFKTKDALFFKIFEFALETMLGKIKSIFDSELPLFEKIELFIENYLSILSKNSFLPAFVISELNRNPDKILKLVNAHPNRPQLDGFKNQINQAIAKSEIIPIDPNQLFVNIISLCVFPYVAKPMIQTILGLQAKETKQLLDDRKVFLKQYIINSIKIKQP